MIQNQLFKFEEISLLKIENDLFNLGGRIFLFYFQLFFIFMTQVFLFTRYFAKLYS